MVLVPCKPSLQLVGEHQVGQLGLAVGGDAVVVAVQLQVVEVDAAATHAVTRAADGHHARARRGQHPIEQQAGEGEVAEVVGAELQFEAVLGGRPSAVYITPALLISRSMVS